MTSGKYVPQYFTQDNRCAGTIMTISQSPFCAFHLHHAKPQTWSIACAGRAAVPRNRGTALSRTWTTFASFGGLLGAHAKISHAPKKHPVEGVRSVGS